MVECAPGTSRVASPGPAPDKRADALPVRFEVLAEVLAEALAEGGQLSAACAVAGRDMARDGASLEEALTGLRTTYRVVTRREPDFAATEALCLAWSDATLEYLHDLSCEDPLTGLTSLAHLRTRLSEIYREAALEDTSVRRSHALVIVELRFPTERCAPPHHFTRALRLVQVSEAMRTVFAGGETIGRVGIHRAVVLTRRSTALGQSVGLLSDLLVDLDLGNADTRVWIEGLPGTPDAVTSLLDELARPR